MGRDQVAASSRVARPVTRSLLGRLYCINTIYSLYLLLIDVLVDYVIMAVTEGVVARPRSRELARRALTRISGGRV